MAEYSWIVSLLGGTQIECLGDTANIDRDGFKVYRKSGEETYLSAFIKKEDINYIQIVNALTGEADGFYILGKNPHISREAIGE